MCELPECVTLTKQLNDTLAGRVIVRGDLGNSPHKFVWYNRTHEEFADLTLGKLVGTVYSRGKWIFAPLEPGYVLVLGECGGKLLYHAAGTSLPKKFHLLLAFDNGASLSAMTQMWGAMELYEQGREQGRAYIQGMR
jgi:formamidopyrimidine-DNA glycosylase